jgi:hypothetical protein
MPLQNTLPSAAAALAVHAESAPRARAAISATPSISIVTVRIGRMNSVVRIVVLIVTRVKDVAIRIKRSTPEFNDFAARRKPGVWRSRPCCKN